MEPEATLQEVSVQRYTEKPFFSQWTGQKEVLFPGVRVRMSERAKPGGQSFKEKGREWRVMIFFQDNLTYFV